MGLALTLAVLSGCRTHRVPKTKAVLITAPVLHDTDDPAIWVHPDTPSMSLIFGTDKNTDGAIYAYDLEGQVVEDKTIRGLKRPNNVDVEYGFRLSDTTQTDILVFTERERQQIRIFSIPDMKPLDGGGFAVFQDEANPEFRLPMGIALYKSPKNGNIYAIVGRKSGPYSGYLYQYELIPDRNGVRLEWVRAFGSFSGKAEIEAIAVDDSNGYVYYADEGVCIRKYNAEPDSDNTELDCFGGEYFKEDIEGIAIAAYADGTGFLLVSDQQRGTFNIFDRRTLAFIKAVDLGTRETDGCDVVTVALGSLFPGGLFVAMDNNRTFHFFDLGQILQLNKDSER